MSPRLVKVEMSPFNIILNLRNKENILKIIARVMGVSEKTCKCWNKELVFNNLISGYRLTNKKSNFKFKINRKNLNDCLELSKKII